MFTGIIEKLGELKNIEKDGTNFTFSFSSALGHELKIDQSLSHNGVCLTVIDIQNDIHKVTAIEETLLKTNLGKLQIGQKVNLERCMPAHGRFDGHIVQGHVDTTALCKKIEDKNGSWIFGFEYMPNNEHITVEKGSICVNGVSLTVVNSKENSFEVAIIPYTFDHTVFHQLSIGDSVNLEFDIVGKYIRKMMTQR